MGIIAAARRRVGALIGGFGFEAANAARRLRNFPTSAVHVNVKLASAGSSLVARARYLALNNGYANNAVEGFATNVVGAGITPSFTLQNKALKKKVTTLFKQWTDEADAEGLTDFYGLQRRVAREMFIAGEVFVRLRTRRPSDRLSVPLQLQILPSEMLPINRDVAIEPANGNTVRQGIEFDAIGRRVAYHFFRQHPGDQHFGAMAGVETVRVPATEVVHLIDPVDAGQLRGVSKLAPAIVKLFLLDIYDDAELDRKKIAAMHALFITTPGNPEDAMPTDEGDGYSSAAERSFDLQPGMIAALEPGEQIQTSSPADSGATYEPFRYRTLLQISAALGIPYTVLTGDMMKANYSNTRASLVEFRRRVEAFQFGVVIFLFCRGVLARWMDLAQLSGALALPSYDVRRREYLTQSWLPPKFDWVDPWKDAKAEIEQINNGLKSRSMAIAERGYDAEEVDEQIKADRDREARLGLKFGNAADVQAKADAEASVAPPIDGRPEHDAALADQGAQ